MFKNLLILLLSIFLLFACSKNDGKKIISEPTQQELAISIYAEAVEALKKGDAFYASKKFNEVQKFRNSKKY
jgi:outer membrane protein assembly factor BamD (BamD/ComL family)